jgi:hypothetical protein
MTDRPIISDRLKSFVVRFCFCTTVGVALLIFGEFAAYYKLARALCPQVVGASAADEKESWAAQYAQEFPMAERVQYKPYVVWRRAPFSGKTINIDPEGVRKTYYTVCDNDAYVIWMFGDSGLWGAGSPDWETIPSLIAKDYGSSGRKTCIKNFGEKAWVSTQELIQVILALKQANRKPDLLIFYDGGSDSFIPYLSGVPDSHLNLPDIKRAFEDRSSDQPFGFAYLRHTNMFQALAVVRQRVAAHFTASASSRTSERRSNLPDAEMARQTFVNYQKNIDLMETLADHYGFHCIFVWQPVLVAGMKPLSAEEKRMVRRVEEQLRPGTGSLLTATYDLAKEIHRPDFLYLGDLFADTSETVFLDFSHVRPEGNRVIANRIFEFAKERGL